MRALVFGATGLIGHHLIKRLLKEKYQVTGVSRSLPLIQKNYRQYNHFLLNIANKDDFSKITGEYDIVFNMAAHIVTGYSTDEALQCLLVNALGTLNILEFMVEKKIKKIIHSSSVTVYGIPEIGVVREDSPTNPIIVYGVSKLTAEKYCAMYSMLHGLKIVLLRYASVYGLGLNQSTALPIFIERAQRNQDIVLFGDGTRSQDYVYVDDVVEANILAAKREVEGIFNIGSGQKTTMKILAETIVNVFKSSSQIKYAPDKLQEFSFGIDISKAKKELGYKPKYNLRSGLQAYHKSLK